MVKRPRADLHAGQLPHLASTRRAGRADLHRRAPTNPRQPRRPHHPIRRGAAKAGRHLDATGQPLHSFRGLLEHMATLARNTITLGQATFDKITLPTPTQQRAFDLTSASIPLSLK
ncbi:MAG: hypothetical protein M3460_28830 [Actinomycetota bacterium]|nr:hypothetical protein [Actinomycetota bacterium]